MSILYNILLFIFSMGHLFHKVDVDVYNLLLSINIPVAINELESRL